MRITISLVAMEGFGEGKTLFPTGFVKFFPEYTRFRLQNLPDQSKKWPFPSLKALQLNKSIIIMILFFTWIDMHAQEFKAAISYTYIYSNKLDKAIQTYNFSRPFITEKQPFLIHGFSPSFAYIFKSNKVLKHGVNLSYSYFRSHAENKYFENTLYLHFLNLGYILHYEYKEKLSGLYTDFIISATTNGLFRSVNGEPIGSDDTTVEAFGIGGDLNLKLGYNLKSKKKYLFSPFVSISCTPYFYAPYSEAVINQTMGLIENNWTGIVAAQIGLAFHIKK